jgi:hypothetical protein
LAARTGNTGVIRWQARWPQWVVGGTSALTRLGDRVT